MGLLKLFAILLLLSFPLGQIIRLELGNGLVFLPNDFFVGVLVLTWLLIHLWKKRKIDLGKIEKFGLAFALLGFFSLLLNKENLSPLGFFVASLYPVRFMSYLALYPLFKEFDDKFKKKIVYLFFISGSIFVIFGFIQYFYYPNLRNLYYLGWDEHLYRLFSSFLDPNFTGIFLALFFIFVLDLFLARKTSRRLFILVLLFSLLTLIPLFLTYSRTAYIVFVASIFTFLIKLGKAHWILFFLFVLFIGILFSPKAFKTEGTNPARFASGIARFTSIKQGLVIFKDHPLFGVGFNAMRYVQKQYGFLDEENWQTSHAGAGVENSFVLVLATTGIIGFALYLLMWREIILLSLENSHFVRDGLVLATIIGFLVSGLFINSLFYPFLAEWVWVLLGIEEKVRDYKRP